MKRSIFLLLVLFTACQGTDPAKDAWQGSWQARWDTDPAGYGELAESMSFEMNGEFLFDGDNLTIKAYGYPGCIFGVDTLSHTQTWDLKGDTLELQNEPDEAGIQYMILEQSGGSARLQLVDDIFITLTKNEES